MGNFDQAADAFQRAARLLGESPKRLSGFARSLIMVQNGVVSEPARKAYERLKALEPSNIEAQTWLAIAREQDGDLKGAEEEYKRLLVSAEDPWKGLLTVRLQTVSERLGHPVQPNKEEAAPAADPAAAAAQMTPEQRDKFVSQMVDGLAARLKENGNDLAGWTRLVRSYVVLGRRDDATTALASARTQFAGDDKSLAELDGLAKSLGLGS
jgi:cytochrome c-type biogenesis protein CcmH